MHPPPLAVVHMPCMQCMLLPCSSHAHLIFLQVGLVSLLGRLLLLCLVVLSDLRQFTATPPVGVPVGSAKASGHAARVNTACPHSLIVVIALSYRNQQQLADAAKPTSEGAIEVFLVLRESLLLLQLLLIRLLLLLLPQLIRE